MRIKILFLVIVGVFQCNQLAAQQPDNPNVILITLDGFRWQELFSGADLGLIENKEYVEDAEELKSKFWNSDFNKRRSLLLPFIWNEVPIIGQIHGNRLLKSKVNLTNKLWFSYPGYNEILTGKADDENIDSNKKINNPNKTILEIVNSNAKFKGKVAAFGSWDVFPYIINEERSGVPVNAGYGEPKRKHISEKEQLLNKLQTEMPLLWSTVRWDAFTHNYALEYMRNEHPKFVYISYGETDDFAHDGDYSAYLKSANKTDGLLKDLWEFIQTDSFYSGNTILLITSDHGRGTVPVETWRHHGSKIEGADQVWFIALGNGVNPLGEVNNDEQLFSTQLAPTILKLFNVDYDYSLIDAEEIQLFKK